MPFFEWQTVYGAEGEHETPYLTRMVAGRLRLHIFHRGDADPDLHDHPWSFWTFPLTSYAEEVEDRGNLKIQFVRAFRLHHRPATYAHRVLQRAERRHLVWRMVAGKIVTIVWVGPAPKRAWGFIKFSERGRRCWIPWREYSFGGGKHAPCQDQLAERI